MDKKEFVAILDECIDQQKLISLVAMKSIIPQLEAIKAKVVSKEIDLIKSTNLDNEAIAKVIDALIAKVKGV